MENIDFFLQWSGWDTSCIARHSMARVESEMFECRLRHRTVDGQSNRFDGSRCKAGNFIARRSYWQLGWFVRSRQRKSKLKLDLKMQQSNWQWKLSIHSQSQPRNQFVNGTLAKSMTHFDREITNDPKKTENGHVHAKETVNRNGNEMTEIEMIDDAELHPKSGGHRRHHRPVENIAKKKTSRHFGCSTTCLERQKPHHASTGCHWHPNR